MGFPSIYLFHPVFA
jgi:hypothetical protein